MCSGSMTEAQRPLIRLGAWPGRVRITQCHLDGSIKYRQTCGRPVEFILIILLLLLACIFICMLEILARALSRVHGVHRGPCTYDHLNRYFIFICPPQTFIRYCANSEVSTISTTVMLSTCTYCLM